jgi:hypothetical protein
LTKFNKKLIKDIVYTIKVKTTIEHSKAYFGFQVDIERTGFDYEDRAEVTVFYTHFHCRFEIDEKTFVVLIDHLIDEYGNESLDDNGDLVVPEMTLGYATKLTSSFNYSRPSVKIRTLDVYGLKQALTELEAAEVIEA